MQRHVKEVFVEDMCMYFFAYILLGFDQASLKSSVQLQFQCLLKIAKWLDSWKLRQLLMDKLPA